MIEATMVDAPSAVDWLCLGVLLVMSSVVWWVVAELRDRRRYRHDRAVFERAQSATRADDDTRREGRR